jgi:hypothetical protein
MKMQMIHASALVALAALPAAAAAFVVACSGSESESTDCTANCDTANGCTGAVMQDCTALCSEIGTLNTAAGCGGSYNAEQTCIANESDSCTDTSACSAQVNTWVACVTPFCMQEPRPVECNDLNGD